MTPGASLQVDIPAFTDALVAHELQVAHQIVAELRDGGAEVETIYTGLFAPALHNVGELWATGTISVAEEHVASALIEQLMGAIYPDVFVAARASRERVLIAAPEGERHAIGLRMVADLLEGRGFDVVFLGADTPRADFASAAARYAPRLAVLAAYTTSAATSLAATTELLLDESPQLYLVAGGASTAIREAVADTDRLTVIDRLGDARATVEAILATQTPPTRTADTP